MITIYPACFYREEKGYSVIFPDLNYLATNGNDLDDAMDKAIECLAFYLYYERKDNHLIAKPSDISSIDPIEVSKSLDSSETINECFVTYVSVDVEEYGKKHFEKCIKKTLTIPMWLNDLAIKNNINFSKVLKEALIDKLL